MVRKIPSNKLIDCRTVAQPAVRGRIMIVDDDSRIRTVIAGILHGNETVEACSGKEAREILEEDQAFDLILCDIIMPYLSGVELHKWLLSDHPELAKRVVFITAGSFTTRTKNYLDKVDNILIEKPFNIVAFKNLIGDLLTEYGTKG